MVRTYRYFWLFFILLSSCYSAFAAEPLIELMTVTGNRIDIIPNKKFKKQYLNSDYFVEYKGIDITQLHESILIIPFVLNVITIVWISGMRYSVASFDQDLYESLQKVKQVFKLMYPNTRFNGELVPEKLVKNNYPQKAIDRATGKERIALLFSHGLDALCTSFLHHEKKQLLITVRGNVDLRLRDDLSWNVVSGKIEEFAQRHGCQQVLAYSNFHSLVNVVRMRKKSPEMRNWRLSAIQDFAWVGLAAPVAIACGHKNLHIASSISWGCPYPTAANPFLTNNFRFAGVQVHHDLFDLSRIEKCEYLANFCEDNALEEPFVRVCPEDRQGKNCCRCIKCIQTMLGFMVAKKDFTKYGFPGSKAYVEDYIRQFVDNRPNWTSYKLWHFKAAQDMLRKNWIESELTPFFRWFLTINFEPFKKVIDWHKLEEEAKKIGDAREA